MLTACGAQRLQDATLFSGTLRQNLDPLGNCSAAQLRDALEHVGLKDLSLDSDVKEVSHVIVLWWWCTA